MADIVEVLKDILRGVCNWRGMRISERDLNDSPPKLQMNIVNGTMESYRLALVFKITSFQGTPMDKFARCLHDIDPYPHGQNIQYTVCDDPPVPNEVQQTIEEIFDRVERNVKSLYSRYF